MEEEEKKELLNAPLNEGVLNTNCGIPIVFVINKSDVVNQSSEKKTFEKNSEFILSHVRSIALEYGATIVYTSGKASFNVNLLYDYICHILFNFDLIHKTNLADKEAYFIPAGFDSSTLLALNMPYQEALKQKYEEIIPPVVSKVSQEEDIQCEDTNTFFESLKKSGIKGKDQTKVSDYFSENKKSNLDAPDMRNFETNIPMGRNPISLDEKDKKYADTKKALKDKLDTKSSLGKKENKEKTADDEKKKKIREEMLAKIGKAKAKKQA
jgi:dynein light intermediate chain 1